MNWDKIIEEVILQVAFPLLVGILLPLVGGYVRSYFSKHEQFAKIVKAAVQFAEVSGLDLVGEEKLSLAISHAQAALDAKGYGYINLDYLIDAINGEVAKTLNFDRMLSKG